MSEWVTPKTDWSASQEEGVKGEDFNRIEGNTLYNYNKLMSQTIVFSHTIREGGTIPAFTSVMARTAILIPPGKKLYILRYFGYLSSRTSRLAYSYTPYRIEAGDLVDLSAAETNILLATGSYVDDIGGAFTLIDHKVPSLAAGLVYENNDAPFNHIVNIGFQCAGVGTGGPLGAVADRDSFSYHFHIE